MKQNKTSKLTLGKTTVSKLDKDQQSKIYGGTSFSSGICESIIATVTVAIIVGVWTEGGEDASKHRTR
jgi:hypothetical protein